MQLTVNSKIIAVVHSQTAQLTPLLGAYELSFPFTCTIHEKSDGFYRWLIVENSRVTLRSKGGHTFNLGLAYPDKAVTIRQGDVAGRTDFTLKLVLLPHQIELLEEVRDGGDLNFLLTISLLGSDSVRFPHDWPEQAELNLTVPQSSWIDQLNASKADNVLLFEVHLPLNRSASASQPAQRHLIQALELLRAGNWRQCVAECRHLAEELGGSRLKGALGKLSGDRRLMTKDDREAVMIAALEFYGHSASHSESQHGTLDYDRHDAKLAMSVAASLVAHHFGS